jgi:murein DD-endopeptidase MepM/ murein hydrolase activator NlpD
LLRSRILSVAWALVLAGSASGITVRDSRIASSVSEQSCTIPRATALFQPTDRQAFLWFMARQVRSGDRLRVEWLDPSGAVSTAAEYGELPNAAELCFTTQLPIAGFAPASQPGQWRVRAIANGSELFSREFTIAGDTDFGGPSVTSVTWSGVKAQEIDFTVQGKNFQPDSLVLIAQYARVGGWAYLATLKARTATATQLVVHYAGLPANEYLVMVENPDQRMSRPMPFLIESAGYKLPMAAGEPWIVTQGPYGTFSHWGNSLHAYDIAPRGGDCVVAMKAGIAYVHDLGLRQDHHHRSFGNYITIDHGNGEFSHYAHLASGTFIVGNGQPVEQGQALARVGNSGYTLGEGGGYHVHVSVTRGLPISSNSIPFQFEDLPGAARGIRNRTVVSTNASPLCDCRQRRDFVATRNPPGRQSLAQVKSSAQVSVAQWWSELVMVPKRSNAFEVTLAWTGAANDLDLHLVSPSGRHYGWYGDTTGYSGQKTNPESFRVPNPEPGLWRISVEGMAGGPGLIDFDVRTSGLKAEQPLVASEHRAAPTARR